MIRDLSDKEIEEYGDLFEFRTDFPERMTQGDWDRLNELRDKRFEGE